MYSYATTSSEEKKVPEEFQKIIVDFISDIVTTFPEYKPIINKWWKRDDNGNANEESIKFVFSHCMNVYPERFFDILYQTTDIFTKTSSTVNTDFLPGISFKYLWNCSEITEQTRATIWKYLQLIMISMVGSIQNKDAFGESAKMFENINEDEFKGKLQETLEKMQTMFQEETGSGAAGTDLPSANDIHSHITGMLGGKLGQLAKEIAEETAGNLNMDMENVTDATGVIQKLFQNPGKLMGLVNNVKSKLESRIQSGDIKESELFSEATEIMQKMKDMPGMSNIQDLLSKMGMAPGAIPGIGKNTKIDVNAMEMQLNKQSKMAKTRERMKQNMELKQMQKALADAQVAAQVATANTQPKISDDEIISIFSTGETVEKSLRSKKEKSKNTKKLK